MNNQTTQCYKVVPSKLIWEGREFKHGDIIRYHSHFGEWLSDFRQPGPRSTRKSRGLMIVDQETLDNAIRHKWLKETVYSDWWSLGHDV
jgi:hypothetical protein